MALPGPPDSLVSVIVPAWNSQGTLAATLGSAAAQTYSNLEILIVDDGATDNTAAVAADFCASDSRARLIRKSNGGLASARNRGIDEAKGQWIAPLDADDLWHPKKIERQLRTFADCSPSVALVYCWYRMIDEHDRVIEPSWAPVFEGSVFKRHLQCNFGTGSSPLIKRSALGDLRYNSEVNACEDWLLQLQIAAQFEIACTRAFLLGYRSGPANMSSDKARMISAHIQMYEIIRREFPARERRVVQRELARWHAARGLMQLGKVPLTQACAEIGRAFAVAPLLVGRAIMLQARRRFKGSGALRRAIDARPTGPSFFALSPDEAGDP